MNLLDKFLKLLKTDRNTFFTYILTLITAYILIDRIIELLFMFFTGMSVNYWGPITYTFAMACPLFAFFFSFSSKLVKSDEMKISFFYVYCISLYIIGISMVTQWLNHLSWILILSAPNYETIITEFSNIIKPALTSFAIFIPVTTFYKLIIWLTRKINDPIFPNDFKDSIIDYTGIDITKSDITTGPYSFENTLCMDRETGKPVKILENRRFDSTLIVGPSGTGKTALLMEPMIARDLEKKYFFKEISKEMGFTALKTGIATLNYPYDNEYINNNFRLNMLTPVEGKEKIYQAYMKKMIYHCKPDGKIIYRDLGLITVSPDFEHICRVADMAKIFNLPIKIVDPLDPNSIGLNPFTIKNPPLCGLIISLVIKSLYNADTYTAEAVYMQDVALQAVQNLVILLKLVYSDLNDGQMPTLQELLKCLTDFDWVQEMCEYLIKNEELSEEYALQITYFKQNFYKGSEGRKDMKRFLHFVTSQLDVLLRAGSVRNIICNRSNNINFLESLENGDIIAMSGRPTEIGGTAHKGFTRFFLFLMMCAIESSPSRDEKVRTPSFLYMDDFDSYKSESLGDIFLLYRKYKVGVTLAISTLAELGALTSDFAQKILSNSSTKVSFGNSTPQDYDWWELEFGERREWTRSNNYDKSKDEGEYSDNMGNVQWEWKNTLRKAKIQGLKFKSIVYKTKDNKGKNIVGFGNLDFLESKYKEQHKSKIYNFEKYVSGNIKKEFDTNQEIQQKFNPKKVIFESNNDSGPVVTDTTDSSYFFNNEDAVSFNLKKKKPNNNNNSANQ